MNTNETDLTRLIRELIDTADAIAHAASDRPDMSREAVQWFTVPAQTMRQRAVELLGLSVLIDNADQTVQGYLQPVEALPEVSL